MIDVARVDVRPRVEQQVDHPSRAREVQRRLPIPTALSHAGRIGSEQRRQQVQLVQVRRGTAGGSAGI